MNKVVEKVTAFITRNKKEKNELLLFIHPNAGIQIPAGTVEKGETVKEALMREVTEETGLKKISIRNYIGFKDRKLPKNQFFISEKTKVYSRPTSNSFDWAELRKGITVTSNRTLDDYTQITFREYDRYPDQNYITYQITGWILTTNLSKKMRRHFFHIVINEEAQDEWEIFADNHLFRVFWSPFMNLPDIIAPHRHWLKYVQYELKYSFDDLA
ncbi:MAG: NUDIX domain-containing protein [Promethearchaeota archaeon]